MNKLAGHHAVLERRLDSLEAAIRARDWEATEFAFDQVARASSKLAAIIPGGNPCPDTSPAPSRPT